MKTRFTYKEDNQKIPSEIDINSKDPFVSLELSDGNILKAEQSMESSYVSAGDAPDTERIVKTASDTNINNIDSPLDKLIHYESLISGGDIKLQEMDVHITNNDHAHLSTRSPRSCKTVKMCYYCNTQEQNLGNHMLENHATRTGKGFKCNICNRIIQKKLYNFNEHLKTHNDVQHFLCPDCGIGFKRAAAHKIHMETAHANHASICISD